MKLESVSTQMNKSQEFCQHQELSHSAMQGLVKNENKIKIVLILTLVTMVIEIISGVLTSSVALLADGWHMGSHSGALFVAFLSYRLSRSPFISSKLNFGGGKFLPLGAYTNALLLGVVAFFMIYESIERLVNPRAILFNEAIGITLFGLVINLICAWLLKDEPHAHEDHDHKHHHAQDAKDINMHGAYIHVIADALTSVLALGALALGKVYNITQLDSVAGLIGAFLILKWAYGLLRQSAAELLDSYMQELHPEKIKDLFLNTDVSILDLHVWKVAPGQNHCELVVASVEGKGVEYYKEVIQRHFPIHHIIVEERVK